MASAVLVLVCLGVILYRCYRYMFERPANFPPGPPKIPIFGSYPFILAVNFKHLFRATETLAKWYGTTILGFHYSSTPTICVHDLDTTKEVLNNPDMDGRPVFPLVEARDPNFNVFGIFFKDGLFWRNQRRFTLRHLRDFGFGRRFDELELHIDEELRDFVDLVKNGAKYDFEKKLVSNDGVVLVPYIFSALPANLFLKCAINERISRKDLESIHIAGEAAIAFQRSGCMFGRIFSMMENLKYIFPRWTGYGVIRQSSMVLYNTINQIVTKQFNTYDPAHERHFLDMYFKQIKEEKEDFSLDQLTTSIVDMIFPPLTAPATTLALVYQRLLVHPEWVAKCQRQIDEVVGSGRLPTLDDRTNLSYVEAVLRESMRLDTLVPNNVPHKALRDTKIGGFDLPKGGLVVTVLYSAHRDEKHFKDPHSFHPERFLGADGKLDLKLDTTVPFGAGKRLCAGETFARNILFLFLSTILQNFNVSLPKGHALPSPDVNPPQTGLNLTVRDFYLKFEGR